MVRIASMLAPRWLKIRLASLVIHASDDRLADVAKHKSAFDKLRAQPKRQLTINSEHGLQFDAPEESAEAIIEWMSELASQYKK